MSVIWSEYCWFFNQVRVFAMIFFSFTLWYLNLKYGVGSHVLYPWLLLLVLSWYQLIRTYRFVILNSILYVINMIYQAILANSQIRHYGDLWLYLWLALKTSFGASPPPDPPPINYYGLGTPYISDAARQENKDKWQADGETHCQFRF